LKGGMLLGLLLATATMWVVIGLVLIVMMF
jgi:hypothetical protein